MIKEVKGNLLSVKTGHIVHGCNGHGVMGSGVARQIRDKYPKCYEGYKHFCSLFDNPNEELRKSLILGTVDHFDTGSGLYIHNAITQYDYGTDSRKVNYEAVYKAFEKLNSFIQLCDEPKVLNFPMIGCGLAGGNWNIVKTIIDEVVDDSIEKVLWIYEG